MHMCPVLCKQDAQMHPGVAGRIPGVPRCTRTRVRSTPQPRRHAHIASPQPASRTLQRVRRGDVAAPSVRVAVNLDRILRGLGQEPGLGSGELGFGSQPWHLGDSQLASTTPQPAQGVQRSECSACDGDEREMNTHLVLPRVGSSKVSKFQVEYQLSPW